jgi:hypothetical protein
MMGIESTFPENLLAFGLMLEFLPLRNVILLNSRDCFHEIITIVNFTCEIPWFTLSIIGRDITLQLIRKSRISVSDEPSIVQLRIIRSIVQIISSNGHFYSDGSRLASALQDALVSGDNNDLATLYAVDALEDCLSSGIGALFARNSETRGR